jgi:serine/threonine-protein kinase
MAKVLVIDDDQDLCTIVEDFLMMEKHTVHSVHTGAEGLELLKSYQYELAILDWDLPDAKGVDLLKRFRDEGGNTPVIMLTGHTTIDDKEIGLDSGANDYLTKPFHSKELAARIRTVFRTIGTAAPPPTPLGTNNEAVLARANLFGTALAAKYEFIEVLGEGGLGIVFKARHPHLGIPVAVKMLLSQQIGEEALARFQLEAQTLCRLEHRNVVKVYDFGITERRQPYMVLECVEGKDLDTILEEEDLLALNPGLDIMIQVCDGLAHAHEMGILHLDVKPGNIVLKQAEGKQPIPKVLDFGLARLRDSGKVVQSNHGQPNESIGSPPYISPEQLLARPLDERADIYSVGCVIYEVFTGYTPFIADEVPEILRMHLETVPQPMRSIGPELDLPEILDRVVAKTLEKDPGKRIQSMKDLRDALMWIKNQLSAIPN